MFFNSRKKDDSEKDLDKHIFDWINKIMNTEIPENVVALNFNLYDDGDSNWSMELVGTNSFSIDDPDWACDETFDFNTRNNPLKWVRKCSWDDFRSNTVAAVTRYLADGKYADIMKKYKGIGVGFVDGDIEIINFQP